MNGIDSVFNYELYTINYFPKSKLAEAEKLINENNFSGAKKLLEEVINSCSINDQKSLEEARFRLAELLSLRKEHPEGDLFKAIALYEEIISSSITKEFVAKAKLALGILYYQEESIEKQWSIAMQYLKEVNENPLAEYYRAEMLRLGNEDIKKNWQEAAQLYEKVLSHESTEKILVYNKAKFALAGIYIEHAEDLDDDFSKATKLLQQIIASSNAESDLLINAKLKLIEIFRMTEDTEQVFKLIEEIIVDKTLKSSYLVRAYQYKFILLKSLNCNNEELRLCFFNIYLFSDAHSRSALEKTFATHMGSKYKDFLQSIQSYFQAININELRDITIKAPLWPTCFGKLEDFFERFSQEKNPEELEMMKQIILELIKHRCPFNNYVKPSQWNALGIFLFEEAKKLIPNYAIPLNNPDSLLAIRILNQISRHANCFPQALFYLTQINYYMILNNTGSFLKAFQHIEPTWQNAVKEELQFHDLAREGLNWQNFALVEKDYFEEMEKKRRMFKKQRLN